jgi:hypothetical protein
MQWACQLISLLCDVKRSRPIFGLGYTMWVLDEMNNEAGSMGRLFGMACRRSRCCGIPA